MEKVTNEDLEIMIEGINTLPFINMNEANRELFTSVLKELIEKRKTQEKLIEQLRKADDYSDKLEWKLMFRDIPDIMKQLEELGLGDER